MNKSEAVNVNATNCDYVTHGMSEADIPSVARAVPQLLGASLLPQPGQGTC